MTLARQKYYASRFNKYRHINAICCGVMLADFLPLISLVGYLFKAYLMTPEIPVSLRAIQAAILALIMSIIVLTITAYKWIGNNKAMVRTSMDYQIEG